MEHSGLTISQKEPKLSRARKIPEWEEYDGEIAQFARKLAEEGIIRSRMVAADANLLANAVTNGKTDPAPLDLVDETEPLKENKDTRDEL
jgi:UDP-glucose:glycoprotein glucosyltransferase